MAIAGHQIGKALCDALGLPKMTRSFVLRAESDQFVTVECEYFVENGTALVAALAEFDLVRRPTPQQPDLPATSVDFDAWMRVRTETAHAAYMARMNALSARDAVVAQKRMTESLRRVAVVFEGIV